MPSHFSVRLLLGSLTLASWATPATIRAADNDQPPTPAKSDAPAGIDLINRLKSAVGDLNLVGDAKSKADAILSKATDDAEKAQKEAGDDRRGAYGKISGIMRSAIVEILAMLDDDQKLLFQNKLRAAAAAPAAGATATAAPTTLAQRIKDAIASLKLSDAQTKKVDAVIEDLQKKADEIRSVGIGPEMPQKFQALREDGLKQMQAILTEDQFKSFQENISKPQPPNPAAAAGAAGRIAVSLTSFHEATKKLDLSDDQKTRVDTAFDQSNQKLKDLLPILRAGSAPEFTEKMRPILQDLRKDLATILTPEQLEKLKTQMQQQRAGAPTTPK